MARWFGTLAFVVSQFCLTGARAQPTPLGPDFQVNSYTTGGQGDPAVGVDAAGNFVVVWASDGGVGSNGLQGQRYDASGTPLGAQFQVNTYTSSSQVLPAVDVDTAGNFVVVWRSEGGPGSDTDSVSVQGRRYDASGTPLGPQFQVNTYTTDGQEDPAVSVDAAGNFVVVWQSFGGPESDPDFSVQGQRFDASGTPLGAQFQVNSYTTGSQYHPSVATDGAGKIVVVWQSHQYGYTSIQAQRYDASGTPLGAQFEVNSFTNGGYRVPAVAADAAGNFVVVWQSNYINSVPIPDTDSASIIGRRYDATGTPLGSQFQVNSYTTHAQFRPAVVMDAAGSFVVAWSSYGGAGSDNGGSETGDASIQAQRYDASGAAVGVQFQVNSYVLGNQHTPALAADAMGNFTVAWNSDFSAGSDTSGTSIQGRRFAPVGLIPGRSTTVRGGGFAKFMGRANPGEGFTLPAPNLTTTGGTLRILDTGTTAGDDTYVLPALGWQGVGSPPGSRGYRYRGAGTPADPCKMVLVTTKAIKALCKGPGVALAPPFTGDVGIVLSLGTTERYCAQFGGDEVRNDTTLTKWRNAPAPAACP